MRNILAKVVEKMKTPILLSTSFFPDNRTVYEIMSQNVVETEGPQMTSQYGAYALRCGLARLYALMRMHTSTRPSTHKHARMRKHAHADQLLFHSNNGFVNAPQYYVLYTLPVLFFLRKDECGHNIIT
jgi:hypothetical protein